MEKERGFKMPAKPIRLFNPKSFTAKQISIDLLKLYFLYLALSCLIVYGLKNNLALMPLKGAIWPVQLRLFSLTFKSMPRVVNIQAADRSSLSAVYFGNEKSDKVILVSHGNAGNLGSRMVLAGNLFAAGSSVLLYDYRGFGASGGLAKLDNLVADGLSAYDYLQNNLGYKNEQIILYGESIGCGVTAQIMQKRHPAAVILQSAFTSLPRAARDRYFFLWTLPDGFMPEPKFDTLAACQKEHPPLLLIHGSEDNVLSIANAQEIYVQAKEPKELFIIKGASHCDIYDQENKALAEKLRQFIGKG
jgi:fermentation-respiration switch protein FrsA (DUF1100 family)